jgi:hypothetical protein
VLTDGAADLTYSPQCPTGQFQVVNLQFTAVPSDVQAATVTLDGNPIGTLAGASTFGPLLLTHANVLAVMIVGADSGDDGDTVSVVVTGYETDQVPSPPPIPVSGAGGAPSSSGQPATNVDVIGPVDGSGNVKVTLFTGASNFGDAHITGPVDGSGNVLVDVAQQAPVTSDSAALTSITASASTGVLLSANANRKGVQIVNEQTSGAGPNLYIAYAATASLTAYTVALPPGGQWEMPDLYLGVLSGIWVSATGFARITETS